MKIIKISFILCVFYFSCKSKNDALEGTQLIAHKENTNIIQNKSTLDSIHHFTMMPIKFNEYYRGSKLAVKNKEYMNKCLDFINKKDIPFLIATIKDTTNTEIVYADKVILRKGDIALNLIQLIDNSLPIYELMHKVVSRNKTISFDDFMKKNVQGVDNIFIPILFKKGDYQSVNYENRSALYDVLNKYYEIPEK